MEDLLDEMRAACRARLYYAALMMAMTVPDLDGVAETPRAGVGERYKRWFEAYMPSTYHQPWSPGNAAHFTGRDAYQFRCSLLHEGSAFLSKRNAVKARRVLFVHPDGGASTVIHLGTIISGDLSAVTLDIPTFIDDVWAAGRTWSATVGAQPEVRANMSRLVRIHPVGVSPFVVGGPVIG